LQTGGVEPLRAQPQFMFSRPGSAAVIDDSLAQQKFDNRCRAVIKTPRKSSRARTKSRAASCSTLGMATATISPKCSSRAKCRASRASVLIRSPEGRCSFDGAATTQSIPSSIR
jgi:hypothetical protein